MTTKNELFEMFRINGMSPNGWPTIADTGNHNAQNMPKDWGFIYAGLNGVIACMNNQNITFGEITTIPNDCAYIATKESYTEWLLNQKDEMTLSGIAMHNPNWKKATSAQAKPHGEGDPVLGFVLADLTNRALVGKEKYGEPLKVFNGRRSVTDLLQELYDGVMYAKQLELELEEVGNDLADVMQIMGSMESMSKPDIDSAVKELGKILQRFKSLR